MDFRSWGAIARRNLQFLITHRTSKGHKRIVHTVLPRIMHSKSSTRFPCL